MLVWSHRVLSTDSRFHGLHLTDFPSLQLTDPKDGPERAPTDAYIVVYNDIGSERVTSRTTRLYVTITGLRVPRIRCPRATVALLRHDFVEPNPRCPDDGIVLLRLHRPLAMPE